MTQGKVERYHRSMKTQILLENYHLPGELESALSRFVDYYDYERYHETLEKSSTMFKIRSRRLSLS